MDSPENSRHSDGQFTENHSVRLTKEDSVRIREIAKARGCDVSDIIRLALRRLFADLSYPDEKEKKALGKSI